MKKLLCLIPCALLFWSMPALAADLEVAEAVITTQVADREPVDAVESYPADVGRLFCFTRIVGAEGETTVTHVWYHEQDELARVDLRVASPDWRTWSSKRILPRWAGDWRVEILGPEGDLLETVTFELL